jgi:hypothetical protein
LLLELLLPVTGITPLVLAKSAEPPLGTATSACTPFAHKGISCGSETAPEVPEELDDPELLELVVAVGAGVAALLVPLVGVAVPTGLVPGVAVPVAPELDVAAGMGVAVAADEPLLDVLLVPEVPLVPAEALSPSMRAQAEELLLPAPVGVGVCAKAVRLTAKAAIVATTRAATTSFFFKTHLLKMELFVKEFLALPGVVL